MSEFSEYKQAKNRVDDATLAAVAAMHRAFPTDTIIYYSRGDNEIKATVVKPNPRSLSLLVRGISSGKQYWICPGRVLMAAQPAGAEK